MRRYQYMVYFGIVIYTVMLLQPLQYTSPKRRIGTIRPSLCKRKYDGYVRNIIYNYFGRRHVVIYFPVPPYQYPICTVAGTDKITCIGGWHTKTISTDRNRFFKGSF